MYINDEWLFDDMYDWLEDWLATVYHLPPRLIDRQHLFTALQWSLLLPPFIVRWSYSLALLLLTIFLPILLFVRLSASPISYVSNFFTYLLTFSLSYFLSSFLDYFISFFLSYRYEDENLRPSRVRSAGTKSIRSNRMRGTAAGGTRE